MCTALFFITHDGIAKNLILIGEAIIKKPNQNIAYYEIAMDADNALSQKNIEKILEQLDLTNGIIFITDIIGGTPSNLAQKIARKHNSSLLTGVNLPMLIRLLNYRNKDKQTLIKKALDGATKSIQHINPNDN